ncbi:MAG: hypothetical protein ACLUAR_00865 [Pilosibacter sp.]
MIFLDFTGLFSILTVLKSVDTLRKNKQTESFSAPRAQKSGCHHARRESGKERLMILLDYKDRRPIYEQVVAKLEELMLLGV